MAAAPAPMFVAVAPGAGITADLAVYLDSSSPFVNGTPFLEWSHHPAVGAAPALSSVPQHKLVMFLLRHGPGPAPADLLAFNTRSPFTANYVAAAWARWLTELLASGLLANGALQDQRRAAETLMGLMLQNASQLQILASDYGLFESFDIPGVAGVAAVAGRAAIPAVRARPANRSRPAVPARPRVPAVAPVAAVPAVPAVNGPALLNFVEMATLASLHNPDAAAPMLAYCRLAALLGACHTRAARSSAGSLAFGSCLVLRQQLAKYIGLSADPALNAANDTVLATQLQRMIEAVYDRLSEFLAIDVPSDRNVQAEFMDACVLLSGTATEREAVFMRRLQFIGSRCAPCPISCARPRLHTAQCRRRASLCLLASSGHCASLCLSA